MPIVLSIAGYDPSAGAGVLADLKTFAANGVYGMACITALTVQSSHGVQRVQALDPGFVIESLDCLALDVRFTAIKVGMLGDHTVATAIVDWLRGQVGVPVVLDPVLQSSSGSHLLDDEGLEILREKWLPWVDWITPNLIELAALVGIKQPVNRAQTEEAASKLQQLAARRGNPRLKVVVTGGHAEKPDDLLLTGTSRQWYPGEQVETTSTHGTGCAFSSALASRVALGDDEDSAMRSAKEFVAGALRNAFPVGQGKGPLNHFWRTAV